MQSKSALIYVLSFMAFAACRTVDGTAPASVITEDADTASLDLRLGKAYPPAYSKPWETNADGTTIKICERVIAFNLRTDP